MARTASPSSRIITRSMKEPLIRRSSRLHGGKASITCALSRSSSRRKTSVVPSGNQPRRRRTANAVHGGREEEAQQAKITPKKVAPADHTRTSEAAKDMNLREKNIVEMERRLQRLNREVNQLEKQLEDGLTLLGQHMEHSAQNAINHLEEHFTCSLCFDILACPYSLNPGVCGHTFCATCILKWFFSRLHRHCGAWHQPVDCPMCRCLLIPTPDATPRREFTFPFTPNRTVDSVVKSMLAKLCEDADRTQQTADMKVKDWTQGGISRRDWERKEREGHELMNCLTDRWINMTSQEFAAIKVQLHV